MKLTAEERATIRALPQTTLLNIATHHLLDDLEAMEKEIERLESKILSFDGGRTQYFEALVSIRKAVTGEDDNKPRVPDTLERITKLRAQLAERDAQLAALEKRLGETA